MRGRRMIAGGQRVLRHLLLQADLAALCHNPLMKAFAKCLKENGKPQESIIAAIASPIITVANAVLKSGAFWQHQPGA